MKEDFVTYELAVKLKEKGFRERVRGHYKSERHLSVCSEPINCNGSASGDISAPQIHEVLKWLRKDKNIDIEIHAEVGILGRKVYIPYISTYTEFTLETSPDVVRYKQKKFNTATPLKRELIPAHEYFEEWEEATLAGIKYVLENLI